MRLTNVVQLGIKELRGLQRDHVMVFLIFFVFTFTVYNQATVSPELLNKASISVVDEDRSQLSARIIGAFYPPRFLPPVVITAGEMDRREIRVPCYRGGPNRRILLGGARAQWPMWARRPRADPAGLRPLASPAGQ